MGKSARRLKFEEALERLDAIVEAMEAGEIGIEESIARYEEAMQLAAHCRQVLEAAEQRIRKIQIAADGTPTLTPFAASPGTAEEEAAPGGEPPAPGPGEEAEEVR